MKQARGPFQVVTKRSKLTSAAAPSVRVNASNQAIAVEDELERTIPKVIDPQEPVARRFDCEHYEACLGLSAALNWESFTCEGCCGELNNQLLWRAHQNCRKDSSLADLCQLPTLQKS